jgi:alkylation response protein AidB-like acyl-CoA dehydrogenase
VDLSFNEEQEMLRNSARKFLQNECTLEYTRKMWKDDQGFTPDNWNKMVELGWLGLRIPEVYGGIGLGFLDLAILFEETGRVALPGPLLSTSLASEVLIELGTTEQKEAYLPRIAAGETRATLAIDEPQFEYGPSGIQLPAQRKDGGYLLRGTKLFVLDAHVSDLILLGARTSSESDPARGITLFALESGWGGISRRLLRTMDGGRKQCEVVLNEVYVPASKVLGQVDEGWPALKRLLDKGAVILSLEMVGGGQKILELAVDYAKIRVQFDQPIGSFQAVKHKCAQMMQEVEGARSIAYYAAWAIDQGGPEAAIAASVAKAYCSEMYRKATSEAIQILGGIGFTWEHDAHIFLKRAKMNEFSFGNAVYHREQLAKSLGY